MANLTLGSEYQLSVHADERLTYADIETALTDAGLTNISIVRYFSGDGYDIQLIIRTNNFNDRLNATNTIRALADALDTLDGEAETPPE